MKKRKVINRRNLPTKPPALLTIMVLIWRDCGGSGWHFNVTVGIVILAWVGSFMSKSYEVEQDEIK